MLTLKEAQSYQFSLDVKQLQIYLISTEDNQRTYLLTGKNEYLDQYYEGKAKFIGYLRGLVKLVYSDPEQIEKLQDLQEISRDRIASSDQTINLKKSGRPDLALALVNSGKGKKLMEKVDIVSREMLKVEELRVANFRSKWVKAMERFATFTVVGQIIILTCAGFALYFLFKIK